MRLVNIIYFLIFTIFSSFSVIAQDNYENLIFKSLSDGVGTRAVSCIVKDHKGIVWIGTQGNGLSSFNGHEFTNYKHKWDDTNTINNSVVNVIYLDTHNNLWVGTEEGLNLYNRNLDQFIHVSINELNSKVQIKAINVTK